MPATNEDLQRVAILQKYPGKFFVNIKNPIITDWEFLKCGVGRPRPERSGFGGTTDAVNQF